MGIKVPDKVLESAIALAPIGIGLAAGWQTTEKAQNFNEEDLKKYLEELQNQKIQ